MHDEKENLSYNIYESLDQLNSKLTAFEDEIISGIMMINNENLRISTCVLMGKSMILNKIIFEIKKNVGNGTSGESMVLFITWIQINLYLVTKKS